MSTPDTEVLTSPPPTAGAQLRAARLAKGVHLAIVSAHLKVPVRQLEALEADAHASLGGAAFVRALALAVCRQLGLDPAPVLAALPTVTSPLAKPVDSIEPLPPATGHKPGFWGLASVPKNVWQSLVVMLGAVAAFVWWPVPDPDMETVASAPVPLVGALPDTPPVVTTAPAAPTIASAQAAASSPVTPTVAATPVPNLAKPATPVHLASPQPPTAPEPALGMRLRVTETMWVEVRDAQGQQPIKRLVKPGETVELPPPGPLFVYLAKGDRAELSWQGKAVNLGPHSQNNEVRLRLQP